MTALGAMHTKGVTEVGQQRVIVEPAAVERLWTRLIRRISVRAAGHSAKLAAVADQASVGVANVAFMAILALRVSVAELGTAGLMLGIYYIGFTIHRGAVGLPFIVSAVPAAGETLSGAWWRIHFAFTGAISVVLGICGCALWLLTPAWASPWFIHGFLGAALITPFLLTAEFSKRWHYQHSHPACAVVGSGTYLVILTAVAAVSSTSLGAYAGAIGWSLAGLATSAWAFVVASPVASSWPDALDHFRPHRRFAMFQSLAGVPHILYNASAVVLFSLALGLRGAAAFTLVRMIVVPAVSIVAAIDSTEKPKAAHAFHSGGMAGLLDVAAKTRLLIAVVVGLYLVPVAALGAALLKGRASPDAHLEWLVPLISMAVYLSALSQPSETVLMIRKRGATMLAARTAIASLATLLVIVAGAVWGIIGCGAAFLITHGTNLTIFLFLQHRETRLAISGSCDQSLNSSLI